MRTALSVCILSINQTQNDGFFNNWLFIEDKLNIYMRLLASIKAPPCLCHLAMPNWEWETKKNLLGRGIATGGTSNMLGT